MTTTNELFEGTDAVGLSSGNTSLDSFGGSGSAEFDSAVKKNGDTSGLFSVASGQNYSGIWTSNLPSSTSELWARFYLRFDDVTPTNDTSIIQFLETNQSTIGCEVQLSTTGAIRLRAPLTLRYTSSTTLTASQWARLEVHVVSNATNGHIEARLFVGANVDGSTPDETFGSPTDNWDTGDGTIGGIRIGCISNPGQSLSAWFDDAAISDTGWPGSSTPAAGSAIIRVGTGASQELEPRLIGGLTNLIPAEGAWYGVTSPRAALDGTAHTDPTGLAEWTAAVSRPHIISRYYTGGWSGVFNQTELDMFDPPGQKHAIPLLHWKVHTGVGTWATVAAGSQDSRIDTFCNGISSYPHKVFMAIHHEPEDNVGGSGFTKADYRAMWQHVIERCATNGVTNIVWVIQYIGWSAWAVDSSGTGFEDLYPGDDYIDWIAWDPYNRGTANRTWARLLDENFSGPAGWPGIYTWATTNHPTKPLMLAETGCSFSDGLTVAQVADIFASWRQDTTTRPAVRAVCYWNARASGDYYITKAGRELAAAEVQEWEAIPWFDQDPDLAKS